MFKKVCLLLLLAGFILYFSRGILVTISTNGDHNISNIALLHDNKEELMDTLAPYQELTKRLRPKHDTSLEIKYKIESLGCFKADIDTYFSHGFVGQADILILNNGNIRYNDRIYFGFLHQIMSSKSWRHKTILAKKISCQAKFFSRLYNQKPLKKSRYN